MAFVTSKTWCLSNKFLVISNTFPKTFHSSCCYSLVSLNHLSSSQSHLKCRKTLSVTSRSSHNGNTEEPEKTSYENLFRISVIEIDNKGNSEIKSLRLETLVNELRATEKLKLDKILNEKSEEDSYNWNNDQRRLERKSIKSKEYQKQKRSQLPLRDLRMFFRHINLVQKKIKQSEHLHHQNTVKGNEGSDRLPSILPRASADCFLLELEHIRLLCKKDHCIVLEPAKKNSGDGKERSLDCSNVDDAYGYKSIAEMAAVSEFVEDLKRNLQASSSSTMVEKLAKENNGTHENCEEGRIKFDVTNYSSADQAFLGFLLSGKESINTLPFELVVLETAFSSVISRLRRHQALMAPLLDVLIHETLSANPPTRIMLRRTLAFKQNLAKFESKIYAIRDCVRNLLTNDQDMADLYLSNDDSSTTGDKADDTEHEEIELLLEAYAADLNHISSEASRMKIALDDTDDFVNTHLSTMRNKIIRTSLFMEMGMFSIAVPALLAGIGGMNLTHGLEEHPYAFYLTCGGMVACTSTLFSVLYGRYRSLDSDTSEARMRHYYALKNYLSVLDEVEARLKIESQTNANNDVENKGNTISKDYVTKEQFGDVLKSVVNAQQDEIDLIFKSFDANRSGVLEMEELIDENESEDTNNDKNSKGIDSNNHRRSLFRRRFKTHKD